MISLIKSRNFRSNAWWLLVATVAVIAAGFWWHYDAGQAAASHHHSLQWSEQASAGVDARSSSRANNVASPEQEFATAARNQSEAGVSEPDGANHARDAWRLGDSANAPPSIPLPVGVSVYEPVSVDMENPAYPEPGDKMTVTLPGGERLRVDIEIGTTNPNGDYTWRGHLRGYGDEYPVVMTYGGNSVFATVTTPKGSYSLVSVHGSGWIYKNPSEFELSAPGASDHLEIPRE
jgi:hypothetical protein